MSLDVNADIQKAINDSYTTTSTYTTGEPVEFKIPGEVGCIVELNSPIDTTPKNYGWTCPKCGRVNAPSVKACPCSTTYIKAKEWLANMEVYVPAPCRTCSNHPSNGGSGICHCTLGTLTIY